MFNLGSGSLQSRLGDKVATSELIKKYAREKTRNIRESHWLRQNMV